MAQRRYNSSVNTGKSNNYVVVDIEVFPIEFESAELQEYLMDKNFPRKMHPMFARVLIIGLKPTMGEVELFYPKDEKELLTRFWGRLQELKPNVMVTFNGYNFDIPFIHVRSLVNGVQPTMEINLNKYKSETSNHFDCMQSLSVNQTFLNVALDISCQVFGIEVPKPRISGEDVPKLYKAGEFDAVKEHCRQDVEITEQLYLKLRGK
ncbi:3'-5' exonuclease [[Eubacterium] cellulosolvens]